jgi:hypothetical protein
VPASAGGDHDRKAGGLCGCHRCAGSRLHALPSRHVFQAREGPELFEDRVLRLIDEPVAQIRIVGKRQQTGDDPLGSIEPAPQEIANPPVLVEKRPKMRDDEPFQLASPRGHIGN